VHTIDRVIRHADAERDAAACAAIYAPYVTDTVISLEERPPSTDEMAGRIAEVSEQYPWLVFEDGGEVTGYAYASRHRPRVGYRWAVDVTVYVAPSSHRRGVGRGLYEALFELLRRQGYHVAGAGIGLPNDASVGFHEALGFEPVGVYRDIAWKAGSWQDVGWWQLRLLPAGDRKPAEPTGPQRLPDD
jgi:phosphinothricin acetyltransferase